MYVHTYTCLYTCGCMCLFMYIHFSNGTLQSHESVTFILALLSFGSVQKGMYQISLQNNHRSISWSLTNGTSWISIVEYVYVWDHRHKLVC